MHRVILGVMVVALLVSASSASAFDGERRGFILGFGIGGGLTSFTQELSGFGAGIDATSERENKGAFATDFRIGGGFSNQFLLYYVSRVSWFNITNVFDNSVTIASGVGGLGVTWYTASAGPSWFVSGLLGFANWSAVFENDSGGQNGFGVSGGGGYEFSSHWSIEASLSWSSPSDSEGSRKVETDPLSVLVVINGLAY